jgi:hypothetical protein
MKVRVRNFSLTLETKRSYKIPRIGGQRGYVSFLKDRTYTKGEKDLKVLAFGRCVCRLKYAKNIHKKMLK